MSIALAALLLTILVLPQQPDPTSVKDNLAPATLRGRVIDKVSGVPIPRAVVTLSRRPDPRTQLVTVDGRVEAAVQVSSDADGRFEFQELSGEYFLSVGAGEFRATHVPYDASPSRAAAYGPERLKSIQLRPGEIRSDLTIALAPALAISGRVVDAAGLGLSDIPVRVRDVAADERFDPARPRSTDDLGAFRIFGLAPGSYRVCAEGSASPRINQRSLTRELRFATTCHESVPGGETVVLADADIEGLQIRMEQHATFFIRGAVLDSGGAPVRPDVVSLGRVSEGGGSSTGSSGTEGGRFTFSNVVPGIYAVSASSGGPERPGGRELEMGLVPVDITTADVDVVVTMKKGARLRGTIVFEDGPAANLRVEAIQIEPQRRDRRWMTDSGTLSATVRPDLSFELKELFGPYALSVAGLPRGTAVKSIHYRGRDVLEIPTEFDGGAAHTAEVVLTRRVAELSGRVLDQHGNPAAGARIMIFPAEPARWGDTNRGAGILPNDGAFRLTDLAAGDYLVVAVSAEDLRHMESGPWYRREPWQRLSTIAQRITLLDNDRRVVDLNLRLLPPESRK